MRIELQEVSKSYVDAGRALPVISGLTLSFPASGTVGIVGMSGVGKSTLLHLLGGLDRPSQGKIFHGDTEISELNSDQLARHRRRNVGFVFQFHHLLGEFSAVENVMLPLLLDGTERPEAERRATQILRDLGLAERASHRPAKLSGGEQQRVAIARAIVHEPGILLADEPTGNLDPSTARDVQSILLRLAASRSCLVIIVTHNHELARALDLTYEMRSGGALSRLDDRASTAVPLA